MKTNLAPLKQGPGTQSLAATINAIVNSDNSDEIEFDDDGPKTAAEAEDRQMEIADSAYRRAPEF